MPDGNKPERKDYTDEEKEKVSAGMSNIIGQDKFTCAVCHKTFPVNQKYNFRGADVCPSCMSELRQREYQAREERQKSRSESVFTGGKGVIPSPAPSAPQPSTPPSAPQPSGTPSTTPESKMEICPACHSSIPEGARKCPKCGTVIKAEKEKIILEGLGVGGKIKELAKGKVTGQAKKYLGVAESHIKTNLQFAVLFPLAILSVFRLLMPTIEGYVGVPITPPYVEHLLLTSWPIILVGLFGVVLPPSVILGKYGVNFSMLNTVCLFSIAGSAAIWGASNILLPAVKYFMPGEYALMMCLAKYGGNMQICVAQNQTVQYDKKGTYETLTLEPGAVTPAQTLNPSNPVPDNWNTDNPYELPLTLFNKNTVGSAYDIKVEKIDAIASPYENGNDFKPASDIINVPTRPIKAGGYAIFTARFTTPFYPERPINCNQYTFFTINVTTEQIGGGSAKFGLIQSDQGIDNQNFMYFFDPVVMTEPGPLDIYTYTLPFVIPVTKTGGDQSRFGVYIQIKNKGQGMAFIENLTLIQVINGSTNQPIEIPPTKTNCVLSGGLSKYNVSDCPWPHVGNCILITYIENPIKKDEGMTFRCNGQIVDKEFFGKTTQLISINANYQYLQTFDEQVACLKSDLTTFCDQHREKETCQQVSGMCQWCDPCSFNRTSAYYDQCIPSESDCGYHCDVNSECNATCDSNKTCADPLFCGNDCTCTYSVPERRGTNR